GRRGGGAGAGAARRGVGGQGLVDVDWPAEVGERVAGEGAAERPADDGGAGHAVTDPDSRCWRTTVTVSKSGSLHASTHHDERFWTPPSDLQDACTLRLAPDPLCSVITCASARSSAGSMRNISSRKRYS